MDFYKYKNLLPFAEDRVAWRKKERELAGQFKQDALAEVGWAGQPGADLLYAQAEEEGHSAGYSEIYNCLLGFVELIEGIDEARKQANL